MPYQLKISFYKVQKYPTKADLFYSYTCQSREQFHNSNNKNIIYAYAIAHHKNANALMISLTFFT